MNEDLAARLALVSLDGAGPARARWLIGDSDAPSAVERLRSGMLPRDPAPAPPGVKPSLIEAWGRQLRSLNIGDLMDKHRSLGIDMLSPVDRRWPFGDDPEPPVLLFYRGDLAALEARSAVAVVGTRRCTSVGRTIAYQLGTGLADHSVAVVSGLALGIDGAAHRGALDRSGMVIGVVGSGLDVVYPGGNRVLWEEVASSGLLLSEAPAGARPERWRFPARNRLIAGLSDGIVVVESHHRGGALLTVDEAVDRGKPVFVIPGSVLSPASDGTNELLVDGATPVRDAADILGSLGIEARLTADIEAGSKVDADADADVQADAQVVSAVSELQAQILAEAAIGPVHLDVIVHATGRSAIEVSVAVREMVGLGLVVLDGSTVSRPD